MILTHTWILALLTSKYSQLSVEKAIAIKATATTAHIVAKDKVTAEQGIFVRKDVWPLNFTILKY